MTNSTTKSLAFFTEDPNKAIIANYKHMISNYALPFVGVGFIIAVLSTVLNGLSLSYFVRKRKEHDVRLFLLLNIYDICVSILATVVVPVKISLTYKSFDAYIDGNTELYWIYTEILRAVREYTDSVYKSAILATAVVTTVLSIHRLILIKDPLKSLNMNAPTIALTVIPILLIPAFVLLYRYDDYSIDWYTSGSLCVLILISFVCNVLAITLLCCSHSPQPDDAHRAAVTVFIISAVFTVLNVCYVVTNTMKWQLLYKHKSAREYENTKYLKESYIYYGLSLTSLPLNYFLNPLIHFIRSTRMRAYLKDLFKRNNVSFSNPDGRKMSRKYKGRRTKDSKV